MLNEIKAVAEEQAGTASSSGTSKILKSRFGAANETALKAFQQELVAKRMEALAERLGLSPEESHIDVRRTSGGRCFGLLRFIVNIGYGVREVTAVEYHGPGQARGGAQAVDRGYFGSSANTAADVLACMEPFKPTEVVAWTDGRLAFLDVIMGGVGASVRVCTKPAPGAEPASSGLQKEGE